MQKLFGLTLLGVSLACAQIAETRYFRAILSPANEVPPITGLNASGAATVQVHVVRDAAGAITSGSVDFFVNYTFPAAITLTGLHIHSGPAGVNAPVTISSGLAGTDPIVSETGRGSSTSRDRCRPTPPRPRSPH
jgi:hypothetical protein